MDLGLNGKRAVVCASSKGLGRGCAEALAAAGASLVLNARGAEALEETAKFIRETHGVEVITVAADVATRDGRAAFIAALDANMLAPVALMQATLPGMIDRKWGRVVNITSGSVKAPIPQLGLSNTARAGLTGFVAGTARQVAEHGVTINNMLPGIHATDRAISLDTGVANAQGIDIATAQKQREATIPARRYGTKEEFGAMCAFLCSQHAGFIVGQNIVLDGGAINATI